MFETVAVTIHGEDADVVGNPDDMDELTAKRHIGIIARRRLAAKTAAANRKFTAAVTG